MSVYPCSFPYLHILRTKLSWNFTIILKICQRFNTNLFHFSYTTKIGAFYWNELKFGNMESCLMMPTYNSFVRRNQKMNWSNALATNWNTQRKLWLKLKNSLKEALTYSPLIWEGDFELLLLKYLAINLKWLYNSNFSVISTFVNYSTIFLLICSLRSSFFSRLLSLILHWTLTFLSAFLYLLRSLQAENYDFCLPNPLTISVPPIHHSHFESLLSWYQEMVQMPVEMTWNEEETEENQDMPKIKRAVHWRK